MGLFVTAFLLLKCNIFVDKYLGQSSLCTMKWHYLDTRYISCQQYVWQLLCLDKELHIVIIIY